MDYYSGYTFCVQNANNHLVIAKIAKKTCYGIANAHLILACEEAVKGVMLFLALVDDDYLDKAKDLDKYFSDHKIKHRAIVEIEKNWAFFDKLLSLMTEPMLAIDDNDFSIQTMIQAKEQGVENLINFFKTSNPKELDTLANSMWWSQANSFKNDGFYVSFIKKKQQWKSPSNISQKQYSKGEKIASAFIKRVESIGINYQNKEYRELYQRFREKYKSVLSKK